MAAENIGLVEVELEQEEDSGHRTYSATYKVRHNEDDGPYTVLNATGLPAIGDYWVHDRGLETDTYARRNPYAKIKAVVSSEKTDISHVEVKFTTKPFKRCQDVQIGNPLLEPAKLSGTFSEQMQKAIFDRHWNAIRSSAMTPYEDIEQETSFPTVEVSVNVASSPVALITSKLHYLNDSTMWGLPAGCIKFSSASWERLYYGVCSYYYNLKMGFKIRFPYTVPTASKIRRRKKDTDTDSDGDITYDEIVVPGNVIVPGWVVARVDSSNGRIKMPGGSGNTQAHTGFAKDAQADNMPFIFLDGQGNEAVKDVNGNIPFVVNIWELYSYTNLLTLPIPSSL